MFVGINGLKTTNIENYLVITLKIYPVIAASDTFRAGARTLLIMQIM